MHITRSSSAMLTLLCASTGLLIGLSSCQKPVDLPPEPRVTAVDLITNGEAGTLLISFEDGDGNFGLNPQDTTGAFCPSCDFHHNVFCTYEELRDGVWTPIELDPAAGQVPFYYRAPWAVPSGQQSAQRGTVSIELTRYYLTSEWDTLRFAVRLADRDLQLSNTERSQVELKP
ncbi:MAG: hypothetical protein P8M07_01325 [Flavobacteriales bacterium]|nr:hypothetical protein [Flavobacteriales bacterium]